MNMINLEVYDKSGRTLAGLMLTLVDSGRTLANSGGLWQTLVDSGSTLAVLLQDPGRVLATSTLIQTLHKNVSNNPIQTQFEAVQDQS